MGGLRDGRAKASLSPVAPVTDPAPALSLSFFRRAGAVSVAASRLVRRSLGVGGCVSDRHPSGRRRAPGAHDYLTLLGAAIQGVGLAQVPGPLAKAAIAEGRLKALLTRFAVTTPGVFLYHPGRRQVLPKLRAFIEHVKHQSADVRRKGTTTRGLRKLNGANSF